MSAPAPAVRTEDMVVVHRIFRRGFDELPGLLRNTPAGDTGRAALVAGYAEFLLGGLHHHHRAEDELIWPRLLERAAPEAELVARMTDQHEAVAARVAEVRALLTRWRATRAEPEEPAVAIERLATALAEHLDEEESGVLPLVRAHLTAGEWQQVGEQAFEGFSDEEKATALGLLEEVATPEEVAMMTADLPLPIRVLWRLDGRRRFTRHMGQVRGSRRRAPRAVRALLRGANTAAAGLYRGTDGRIGGTAKGLPTLLLTVPGRRTGTPRDAVLAYFAYDGGYLVAGSAGGAKAEPQWMRNLAATSRAQVRIGGAVTDVAVRMPDRAERDTLWSDVFLSGAPFFADYERRAERIIRVAVLTPLGAATPARGDRP